MKNKIVFIIGVLFAVNVVYSEFQYCPVSNKDSGYIHNGQLVPKCTENDSPEIWSGSWEDLQAVAKRVKEKFSFETTKHKSRDIASLKPASKQEMEKHISNGNYQEWNEYIFDSYHESPNVVDALKTEIRKIIPVGMFPMLDVPILLNDVMKVIGGKVVKYTTHRGDEVVYSKADGRIILDEQLGTRNFGDNYDYLGSELFTKFTKQSVNEIIMNNVQLSSLQPLSPLLSKKLNRVIQLVMEFPTHKERDMDPHENDNQYKYAGILFESDSYGRFYIIDGQTGMRMTKKQVEDFPTTFSDMWKDKGLVCVESDAIDIVPPKENRQSAQNAFSEVGAGVVKSNVAKTDADEEKDSNDKGMSPESVTVDTNDDGGVGVRGWCKCVNNDDDVIAVGFGGKTSKASYTDEEHELMRSRFKASRFHSYVYFICRQCGRCSTKGKIGGSGPLKNLSIFDFTLAEQFEEEKKTKVMSDSDYRRHNATMIGVNKKLLTIPEGQIVIPGSCLCLKPDLVTVGLAASDKFQVCRYCGWKWVSAKE